MTPHVIPRECGGFLAVTPAKSKLRFGVTGRTEEEASENFSKAAEAWARTLRQEQVGADDAALWI